MKHSNASYCSKCGCYIPELMEYCPGCFSRNTKKKKKAKKKSGAENSFDRAVNAVPQSYRAPQTSPYSSVTFPICPTASACCITPYDMNISFPYSVYVKPYKP